MFTNADGSWSVGNLLPGEYLVTEVTPDGYFDGKDAAGTAGGAAHNPGDLIDGDRAGRRSGGRRTTTSANCCPAVCAATSTST